jgi:two-component sensor histidine kinase
MDSFSRPTSGSAAFLHRQSVALDFGAVLLGNPPLLQIWQDAAVKIADGSGAQHSRAMRYRAETDDLEVCAGVGWSEGMVGSSLSADTTPAGRSFRTRMPISVEDIMNDARFAPDERLHGLGVASLLDVPVRVGQATYGSLEIDRDERGCFPPEDLAFLQTIAQLMGLGLMRYDAAADAAAAASAATASSAQFALALRELKHRTVNNLQTIMATLNIEMRATNEPAVREALQRVMRRVSGIGRAEASLANAERGGSADLQIFLRGLCAAIAMPKGVRMVTDLVSVRAERRAALPIGLIVNEAVMNSLKYAFPDQRGTITVALQPISDARARVSIRDDGIGLFADWKPGSGTEIMNALAHNFGATIMRSAGVGGGTAVTLEFPTGAMHEQEVANGLVSAVGDQTRDGDE